MIEKDQPGCQVENRGWRGQEKKQRNQLKDRPDKRDCSRYHQEDFEQKLLRQHTEGIIHVTVNKGQTFNLGP